MNGIDRDTADVVRSVREHGFGVLRNAVSDHLRAEMLAASERLLASDITQGRDRGGDGKDGFRGFLHHDRTFLPLLANERTLPALVELLSPNLHLLSSHLIALPSGEPKNIRVPELHGWHRDMYGVTDDLGFANTPCMAIKVAHFISPLTDNCGITMFLPGSHTATISPTVPAGAIDPEGAVTPEITGNDVVLFENRTWHASGVNRSGRPRIALMLQYGYRWLQPVDDSYEALRSLAGLDSISSQLLGAPDRNPDGSLAKGKGATPLREWARKRQPA